MLSSRCDPLLSVWIKKSKIGSYHPIQAVYTGLTLSRYWYKVSSVYIISTYWYRQYHALSIDRYISVRPYWYVYTDWYLKLWFRLIFVYDLYQQDFFAGELFSCVSTCCTHTNKINLCLWLVHTLYQISYIFFSSTLLWISQTVLKRIYEQKNSKILDLIMMTILHL